MKMINLKKTSIVMALIGSLFVAQASAMDASTERKLVKICKAIASDSKLKLHKAVKQSRLGYRQVTEGLMCNGKSAFDFAKLQGANNTAGFIAKKTFVRKDAMLAKN